MAPIFSAKTLPFSSCTEVGFKAFKKKKKSPLAFQSIPSGFFRSPSKGAMGLLGQHDPITNVYGALRLCTVPSRQQVPIKYLSAKWISRLPTVSHLALTSLSDYRLCLPWAVSREAVRRHIWGGARAEGTWDQGTAGEGGEEDSGWWASGTCQEKRWPDKRVIERPRSLSGNFRRHLGVPLPSGDELEFQPPIQMLLFPCLSPPVSEGSRLCLFVMHSAAIHKQIDINLCQPFLFKNMNYSRNITILIRNH